MNRKIFKQGEIVKVKPQWGKHARPELRFGAVVSDGPLNGADLYDVELTTGGTIKEISGDWLEEASEEDKMKYFPRFKPAQQLSSTCKICPILRYTCHLCKE